MMPGRMKPRVLPEPVLAIEIMSLPHIAVGHDTAWITVGLV